MIIDEQDEMPSFTFSGMLYSILILELQTTRHFLYPNESFTREMRRVETETGNALVSKQVCCLVSQNRIIDQPCTALIIIL